MMRSLWSAIGALKNHQLYLDVVASNVANVNTTAYKASSVTFQELMSQTLSAATASSDNLAGTNAIQVGLGMTLGSIDTNFTQGSLESTGDSTNLAIQGDGFFTVDSGAGYLYTRDGTIDVSAAGTLVMAATGMSVMGWAAAEDGTIDTTTPLTELTIPYGESMARATSQVKLEGNLSAEANVGDVVTTQFGVYDSLGAAHTIELEYTRAAGTPTTWNLKAYELTVDSSGNTVRTELTGAAGSISDTTIAFDDEGQIVNENTGTGTLCPTIQITAVYGNGAQDAKITIDLSTVTGLATDSEVDATSQNGLEAGSLQSFSVDGYGAVIGVYSNGLTKVVGQLALASFVNPGGLLREGQNLYAVSVNSGTAQYGTAGSDGCGTISAGYLEMSNVDLASQFTNMIVAQRGFQANSRVITTSDQLLEELVNLKR